MEMISSRNKKIPAGEGQTQCVSQKVEVIPKELRQSTRERQEPATLRGAHNRPTRSRGTIWAFIQEEGLGQVKAIRAGQTITEEGTERRWEKHSKNNRGRQTGKSPTQTDQADCSKICLTLALWSFCFKPDSDVRK